MAGNVKFSLDKVNHDGKVIVESKGTKYVWAQDQSLLKIGADGETSAVASADAKRIIQEAITEINTNAKGVAAEVRGLLPSIVEKISDSDYVGNSATRAKASLAAAKSVAADIKAEELETLMKNHPDLLDRLSEEQTDALKAAKHDLGAMQKAADEAAKKTAKISELQTEFSKIIGTGKRTDMEAFVQKNGAYLKDLKITDEQAAKFPVFKRIKALAEKAKPELEKLVSLNATIAHDAPEKAAEAKVEMAKVEAKLANIFSGDGKTYEAAIKASLPKELANNVHAISPKYGIAAEGAAKSAAQKGGKLFSGGEGFMGFMHTAETAGADVAKVGKFRWGKAAAIGIPVAAVFTVIGMGSADKARQQMESQGQGRAAGLGA